MRILNSAGIALIKSFEGLRLVPYQDSGGIWTIGYGHTRGITRLTSPITELQAGKWLLSDITAAQQSVERRVKVLLNDNQYAALVSLTYNAGTTPLTGTLGQKLGKGDYAGAAEEFLKWNHAGGLAVVGLTRRRMAEKALFLMG